MRTIDESKVIDYYLNDDLGTMTVKFTNGLEVFIQRGFAKYESACVDIYLGNELLRDHEGYEASWTNITPTQTKEICYWVSECSIKNIHNLLSSLWLEVPKQSATDYFKSHLRH